MNVKEFKKLLENYPDEAIIQINVSDYAETIGLSNIGVDNQYDKSEALVLTVDIEEYEESLYFSREM